MTRIEGRNAHSEVIRIEHAVADEVARVCGVRLTREGIEHLQEYIGIPEVAQNLQLGQVHLDVRGGAVRALVLILGLLPRPACDSLVVDHGVSHEPSENALKIAYQRGSSQTTSGTLRSLSGAHRSERCGKSSIGSRP